VRGRRHEKRQWGQQYVLASSWLLPAAGAAENKFQGIRATPTPVPECPAVRRPYKNTPKPRKPSAMQFEHSCPSVSWSAKIRRENGAKRWCCFGSHRFLNHAHFPDRYSLRSNEDRGFFSRFSSPWAAPGKALGSLSSMIPRTDH